VSCIPLYCFLWTSIAIYSTYPKFGNARDFRRVPKEVAITVDYFLIFFSFFLIKGRGGTNGFSSLGTRCRSILKSGYVALSKCSSRFFQNGPLLTTASLLL
jgi:hypothetical protein